MHPPPQRDLTPDRLDSLESLLDNCESVLTAWSSSVSDQLRSIESQLQSLTYDRETHSRDVALQVESKIGETMLSAEVCLEEVKNRGKVRTR